MPPPIRRLPWTRPRHLIEVEGVHAIVRPECQLGRVADRGNRGRPGRHSADQPPPPPPPQLSTVPDNDFFFRTALSDAIQGPVLASLTRERGFDNVGFIYLVDAYGQGLATAFARAWDGTLRSVALEVNQTTYLEVLRESAGAGAQALVVVTPEEQALALIRTALDEGLFDQFVFGDAAKRLRLVQELGGTPFGRHVRHGGGVGSRQ